jgi:hypothetical protein
MLMIKNFYNHLEFIYYDSKAPNCSLEQTIVLCPESRINHIDGFFSYLGGTRIIVCRDGDLFLVINSKKFPFYDITIITSNVNKKNCFVQTRHICVSWKGTVLYESDYDEIESTFEDDMTPFIDDEDFDFGLFLENLAKDAERQDNVFRK